MNGIIVARESTKIIGPEICDGSYMYVPKHRGQRSTLIVFLNHSPRYF